MRARDTTPEAHAIQLAIIRRTPLGLRAESAVRMSSDMREVTLAGIRHRHPSYDDQTARYALFRLVVGDELFRRAWPGAPRVDP